MKEGIGRRRPGMKELRLRGWKGCSKEVRTKEEKER